MTGNYLRYYDLEAYLFEDVHDRFHRDGLLDAFDLFSIVVWKANRSKSLVAERLLRLRPTLEEVAAAFAVDLRKAENDKARFLVAGRDWGFALPMASAILTVLWPDDFTVYDVRVCDQLKRFHKLKNWAPERAWPAYCEYRDAVRDHVSGPLSRRDKDRFLWGRSAARQLARDVSSGFATPVNAASESVEPTRQ